MMRAHYLPFALIPALLATGWCFGQTSTYTIATVAGGGNPSYPSIGDGGLAVSAYLSAPRGLSTDSAGNLFIAESRIRKVTPAGIVSTAANYNSSGVAADASANLYVAVSSGGGSVVRISPSGSLVTLAQLPTGAFGGPDGIAIDNNGNTWFSWRSAGGHVVSEINSAGNSTVVAGGGAFSSSLGDGGPATSAYLSDPRGLAVDAAGNLYIADFGNNRIRKVAGNGVITTIAGNTGSIDSGDGGLAAQAGLAGPSGVAVDASGNVYVAEFTGNRVRVVRTDGTITTIAGTGSFGSSGDYGLATNATLGSPYGIAVAAGGSIYVSTGDGLVRVLQPAIPAPAVTSGGVGPVFSSATTIQPGEWVSIYGSNLATATVVWTGNFPTILGGTTVTINGKQAYLWFVSPGQINLQAPDDTTTGPVPVVITTALGSAKSTVTLAPYAPSFSLLDGKHVTGIILRNGSGAYGGGSYDIIGPTGTSFGYSTVAAKAGDSIYLYGVGFGPTNPQVPAGQVFLKSAPVSNPVTLSINNTNVTPSFVGLSGAGLYQFNLTIPAGLGTGDVPLQAIAGGVQTPSGIVISLQ
jgi:uncharacterized protein (TIGR03437 family)